MLTRTLSNAFSPRILSGSLWRRQITKAAPGMDSAVRGNFPSSTGPARDLMIGETTGLPDIEPALLKITRNTQPKPTPPNSSLVFGRVFTDHMLTIKWSALNGWDAPQIGPYGPLSLEPSSTVLHYAQCLFEGLKAYRDVNGKVTMFRPDLNMKRMNISASRLALPNFNAHALQELIFELVRLDKHWIPQEQGHSLYIRPTLSLYSH